MMITLMIMTIIIAITMLMHAVVDAMRMIELRLIGSTCLPRGHARQQAQHHNE